MTDGSNPSIPELLGEAAEAVKDRGRHIQIIAAAGAGKTEVVSQRIAALVAEEVSPDSIVAFTFTEKAAAELKERVRQRVTALVGLEATDQLGRLYIGTIHGYCFRLLQDHVAKYETYAPLDEHQMMNLLYREQSRLGLKKFNADGRLFRGVQTFQSSVDVVENELLALDDLPDDDFKTTLRAYYEMLDRYQFMSFGTQITKAVEALRQPDVHAAVTGSLEHLIVDEYQDVNPAQEELIRLLSKPAGSADLLVVGDDDQAIYQWRGSNVANIVTFSDRYPDVAQFSLLTNRRSRSPIVQVANGFAQTIPGRLPKEMGTHRAEDGPSVSFAIGHEDEQAEADAIAADIEALRKQGVAYRDIAILVRSRTAYPQLLDSLEAYDIPVQPGGRTGLFTQPEAAALGATMCWIGGVDWAPARFQNRETVMIEELLDEYVAAFGLDDAQRQALQGHLIRWKQRAQLEDTTVSLVGEFYELAALVGVANWDLDDPITRNRMGTLARFTSVLADYETVTRRSRRDPNNPNEQVGGAFGGPWYYKNLAILLTNYANGNYDDFDGEEDLTADAVALGTIHAAKGLEWPVVFMPSLTNGRFPSSRTGQAKEWLIPRDLFDAERYEGSDADERRLFYVALTRARDWVSLSSHSRVNTRSRMPSPYLHAVEIIAESKGLPTAAEPVEIETPDLNVTYSEIAAYASCPQAFLLRSELGFMPPVQAELGYGNAVHHLLRMIAERTKESGKLLSPREVNKTVTNDFFLPFANKPAHKEMREKARKLVHKYLSDHSDDLLRTWATEHPFELYLDGVVISGRADVIYDEHDGEVGNLAIVDYKTSTGGQIDPLQLQVYTSAGRREGLAVGAAYIHDLGTTTRHAVDVSDSDVSGAEAHIIATADSLKQRDFTPAPEASKCRGCDVQKVCKYSLT